HNNGKGIKIALTFIPCLPPLKAGEKCRKNAKPKLVNKVFYIDESSTLVGLLGEAFGAVDLEDATYRLARDHKLTDANFTIQYTIPRTTSKDITITGQQDVTELLEEAVQKKNPEVKLLLTMTQEKGQAEENTGDDSDSEHPAKKKSKLKGVSKEEKEQAHIITQLSRLYRCDDKQCPFDVCYVSGKMAQHIHLTFMHLRAWAAAFVCSYYHRRQVIDSLFI
ncbi:hypothetical protein FA95DRAFT_1464047, partial [Auriscalpium vulgare]